MSNKTNKVPLNPYNDKYSSLIRPIKIFLPTDGGKNVGERGGRDDFVGRERLMERLYNWLFDKKNDSGSYLVTGFRGMGKTKLVERVINRLTRDVDEKSEPWWLLLSFFPVIAIGLLFAFDPLIANRHSSMWFWFAAASVFVWFSVVLVVYLSDQNYYERKKSRSVRKYPNHKLFDKLNVYKLARGKNDDYSEKRYSNIKISINLGHEVLMERDVLSLIATAVRDKYRDFVKSSKPHLVFKSSGRLFLALLTMGTFMMTQDINQNGAVPVHSEININSRQTILDDYQEVANNQQEVVSGGERESWFSRIASGMTANVKVAYQDENALGVAFRFLVFILLTFFFAWVLNKLFMFIPYYAAPIRAMRRLDTLTERLNTITGEETSFAPNMNNSYISLSLFNRRRQKTKPLADIREIETELADIINLINSNSCHKPYQARFIVVLDEMDKIDPALTDLSKGNDLPEFTDSVKGFPDGMDSRERRRNVLQLLANIKLFVSSAKAKFVFISGRELYDAYLADLSDRDFAISSIFSGVLNVDSFLTPEGGQTDVRSMSEWYIANRLLPYEWLRTRECRNAKEYRTLKKELPSLRWYYEYLIEKIDEDTGLTEGQRIELHQDANYVVGFLHTFAAYLTHISNGSPKKIFLYFEKNIRRASNTLPLNDWADECVVGVEELSYGDVQKVLYFDWVQQKTINFVYYLTDPIMGTITNDLSNFGDRFLVSLSFIIDHIYKHHNRSFSWRNLEQIPDLLKTSKAPELRDSVSSIMEYLSQIHISHITIGLNEYKFRRSIAEEISMMSKMSDEASALFNFTLDESLSVIQHNARLLNYYIELDRKQREHSSERKYLSIIARIHSNLGDLHYWDEDYYAASLEYRAAIESLPNDASTSSFLTKLRSMLKLGLAYESRKLYTNCYQIYTKIIGMLIDTRWVDETALGMSVLESRTRDWRGKQHTLYNDSINIFSYSNNETFENQFKHKIFEGNYNKPEVGSEYGFNFDEAVSTLSRNLTPVKSSIVGRLTLFEEVRYVYQAILAKLSIIEKMDMSGITQTNIDVAEGEFRTIHKSVNVREKFVLSADFFRKLAEILYYKNSLTILTQNQDAFYATVYYGDYDLLSNLDDFVLHYLLGDGNAMTVKHDVKFFFNRLNNVSSEKKGVPHFEYSMMNEYKNDLQSLFEVLKNNLGTFFDEFSNDELPSKERPRVRRNVEAFISYNVDTVHTNSKEKFLFSNLSYCDYHRQELRKQNLRPPCYACKYYTRSLRILADNMFEDHNVLMNNHTKALGVLKNSFKKNLLYTGSIQVRSMAQTLEGFGNVLFSCSSGDDCEGKCHRTQKGISPEVIQLLQDLCLQVDERDELRVVEDFENRHSGLKLSRLDKSILYYWDAYRFYLIDSSHNEAAGCLNKIINIIVYYIEVLHYYNDGAKLLWQDETDTIVKLIGDGEFYNSFLATLFMLVGRNTGYKYDQTNLTEINELKWIYSLEMYDNIDLSRLSLFPNLRSAWLRIVEARAKGLRYLAKRGKTGYSHVAYVKFITKVYPLIAPKRRYETTSYEEVLGYYTKLRFNDHVLNNILGGNVLLGDDGYADDYHIVFYERLAAYLKSTMSKNRMDYTLFGIKDRDAESRLGVLEYLIHDTLLCVTSMLKVFAPHVHISSYSNSFIGIVYNFYWEWIRKYELLYSLYLYHHHKENDNMEVADKIIDSMVGRVRRGDYSSNRERLVSAMNSCCRFIPNDNRDDARYGSRADRLYGRLRHDIDDIAINTIFSNYAAEMALKYYKMAEETNTEGQSYKSLIGTLYFLNDDFNNDTCQFNIACDRFLLNCGVVAEQHRRLNEIYKNSSVYGMQKAYITEPHRMQTADVAEEGWFGRSQFINSEYNT